MDKVVKERFRALAQELKLQAAEYERRLQALNHENRRLDEILKQSVPREVYANDSKAHTDRHLKDIEFLRADIQKNLDEIKALQIWKEGQVGSMKVIKIIVGAAIAILVGIAIKIFS